MKYSNFLIRYDTRIKINFNKIAFQMMTSDDYIKTIRIEQKMDQDKSSPLQMQYI